MIEIKQSIDKSYKINYQTDIFANSSHTLVRQAKFYAPLQIVIELTHSKKTKVTI
jgi:hypothetical protein